MPLVPNGHYWWCRLTLRVVPVREDCRLRKAVETQFPRGGGVGGGGAGAPPPAAPSRQMPDCCIAIADAMAVTTPESSAISW